MKFGWPVWFAEQSFAASFIVGEKTFLQMNLITAHVAVGSLILAFWTVHMLRCRCSLKPKTGLDAADSNENDLTNYDSVSSDNNFEAAAPSSEDSHLSPQTLPTSG